MSKSLNQQDEKCFNPNCKVCTHPRRDEIEIKRLVEEMPLQSVVKWCEENIDFFTSYNAIWKHFDKHVSPKRTMQVKYLKERRDRMIEEMPNTHDKMELDLYSLRQLDRAIAENTILLMQSSAELKDQMANKLPKYFTEYDSKGKITGKTKLYRAEVNTALTNLFNTTCREVREALKTKYEILGLDEKLQREDKQSALTDILYEMAVKGNSKDEVIEVDELPTIIFDDEDDEEEKAK